MIDIERGNVCPNGCKKEIIELGVNEYECTNCGEVFGDGDDE